MSAEQLWDAILETWGGDFEPAVVLPLIRNALQAAGADALRDAADDLVADCDTYEAMLCMGDAREVAAWLRDRAGVATR